MGLLTPDSTILVKAVAGISAGVFDKGQNSEMAFRVSLVRSLLQVDSKPTMDTVMQFHNHLLGEMEQLASLSPVRKGVVASSPSGGTGLTPNPKAKSLQAQGQDPNDKPPKAKTPCMFFSKRDTGCSRGRKCPYLHSWDGVPDKPSRCRECSSTKHFAKDCPTKANDAGKGKGKGKDGKGNQITNQDPNQNNTNPKGPPSNKKVLIEEESAAAESSSSQTAPPAADLKALMGEVGKALKAFSPSNMKTLIIEECGEEKAPKWDCSLANIEHLPQTAHRKMAHEETDNTPVEGDTGLVDSGATHALRSGTEAEMQKAINVPVTLAGDEKATLQQSQLGTILVPSPSKPIVPMGALVEVLGCTIKWTKTALKIWHPKHGHLKVGLRNRCSGIAALDALQLIKELEEKQLEEFNSQLHEMELRLEAFQCDESKSWTEHLLTFRKDGSPASMWKALRTCPFTKDLPVDVLEMMVEGFDPSKGWEYPQRR